jgi:hypothetical protein
VKIWGFHCGVISVVFQGFDRVVMYVGLYPTISEDNCTFIFRVTPEIGRSMYKRFWELIYIYKIEKTIVSHELEVIVACFQVG